MNLTLHEGALAFHFSRVLAARRWDGSPAYARGVSRLAGTKAADFCAILEDGSAPALVEVTDYRGHRISPRGSKQALASGSLVDETIAKIRDSVAGMLWACARSLDPPGEPTVETLIRHIVNRQDGPPKLQVVFWLEDDVLDPQSAGVLARQIEAGLRHWMRPKVIVTNRRIERETRVPLPWLSAT